MKLPDELDLKGPNHCPFEPNDPIALQFIEYRNALVDQLLNDTLYIKFINGDRKGAIARLKPDPEIPPEPTAKIDIRWDHWDKRDKARFKDEYFHAICCWDGRSNKVKISFPSYHDGAIFLPNYKGPTVWALFDRKSAQKKALESPEQYDIDGRLLAVGDKVLYINARYGSGMCLCHGIIKEFKASVDSRKKHIATIIQNSADKKELSKVNDSKQMIYKLK